MLNKELLLTPPPLTNSILLPFIRGLSVSLRRVWGYVHFLPTSLVELLRWLLYDTIFPITKGTSQRMFQGLDLPNLDAVGYCQDILSITVPLDMYIFGTLSTGGLQCSITMELQSDAGYSFLAVKGAVLLDRVYYILGCTNAPLYIDEMMPTNYLYITVD